MIEENSIHLSSRLTPNQIKVYNEFLLIMGDDNLVRITKDDRKIIEATLPITRKSMWESLKALESKNILKRKDVNKYMVNPEIAIKCSRDKKQALINSYKAIMK